MPIPVTAAHRLLHSGQDVPAAQQRILLSTSAFDDSQPEFELLRRDTLIWRPVAIPAGRASDEAWSP